MQLTVNDRPQNVTPVDQDMPLLWLLREQLGLTGTKFGCGAGPKPTDEQIDAAITNLCRCGTYPRVKAAIKQAAGMAA